MQEKPVYGNLIQEIIDSLMGSMERAERMGIRREMIVLDPGIGFGKTFDHNLEIIRELNRFSCLGRPILLGSSRKAFIGHILGKPPLERDTGTMATVAVGVMNGAHIVRVHDVKRAVETVKVVDAIKRGGQAGFRDRDSLYGPNPHDARRPPTDVVGPPTDVVGPPTDVVGPPTDVRRSPQSTVPQMIVRGAIPAGANRLSLPERLVHMRLRCVTL